MAAAVLCALVALAGPAAGKLAKVKLKAKASKAKPLLRALGAGTTAKAKIKLKLVDALGNSQTKKKSVKLVGG